MSLLLAIAIWFLIRDYLIDNGEYNDRSVYYDQSGYDRNGYDRDGYDRSGYDRSGYDRNGYDRNGKRPPKAILVKPQSPSD